jgi:hypothetical protein
MGRAPPLAYWETSLSQVVLCMKLRPDIEAIDGRRHVARRKFYESLSLNSFFCGNDHRFLRLVTPFTAC